MATSSVTFSPLEALRSAGDFLADLVTPTVRLGVTGLARAGKTVFITALVRNLIEGGRLPFFGPVAEGRLLRAYLEPQPDDALPRFAYEEHLEALAGDPPRWPESTRRISQLRVTIEYVARGALKRSLGINRLHVDIVDYPGEWLLDLGLAGLSYRDWSQAVLSLAREDRHSALAAPWLAYVDGHDAQAVQDERVALVGSRLYASYLEAARRADPQISTLGPGRLLMPGDLEGSPLLTFTPLPIPAHAGIRRGSLAAMMERRYDAYKAHVVTPFFRDHFSRIDRQIVLVDAFTALNGGEAALAEIGTVISAVMTPFRTGASIWPMSLLTRRIDRVLFAAAKADHVHHSNHNELEAVLARLARQSVDRAEQAGAEVKFMALSALRATREGEVKRSGDFLDCIVGTPLAGEVIAGQTFDGRTQAAIFPGDLPSGAAKGPAGVAVAGARPDVRFIRFRPPRISRDPLSGAPSPWPHIRLDRALDFLLGDRLA
ncbi:MAG: YcjX family protein [Hyphomicrobiaceae bacterium]